MMMNKYSFYCPLVALFLLLTGCEGGQGGLPYDRDQLIETMTELDQQADVIWGNSGSEWDEQGERELYPTTDAGWAELAQAGQNMAAIGKRLGTMVDKNDPRAEAWQAYAKGVSDVSMKLVFAAEEHNKKTTFDDGGVLYQVCTACHATFPAPDPEE